jgi:hypothetical protein
MPASLTLQLVFDPSSADAGFGRFLADSPSNRSKVWYLTGASYYQATGATVAAGGSGYKQNDVLTAVGGSFSGATFSADVANGAVTGVTLLTGGAYLAAPTGALQTSGGAGSGATLNVTSGPQTSAPIFLADNPTSPFSISLASGIQVNVQVSGVSPFPNNYTLNNFQIFAVFGRGPHHGANQQQYASPFGVPHGAPRQGKAPVCTVFTLPQPATGSPATLQFNNPVLKDSGTDIFEFNVGVVASVTPPGSSGTSTYTFGHDPDLQVDN